MQPVEVIRVLEPTLSNAGFKLDEVHDAAIYGNRRAWAVYYHAKDCKLQICWSCWDGGTDLMLASLGAPNEFGLLNRSKKWQFILLLADAHDALTTPELDADDEQATSWLATLFHVHFEAARNALLSREIP